MAYLDLALMAESVGLLRRITACAAREGIEAPEWWVATHRWQVVARSDDLVECPSG